jgi:hypothetical protein
MTDRPGDLKYAAELIKMGNKAAAREIVMEALRTDRMNEQGWLYMAACAINKEEFAKSIQQVFKLNPLNPQALSLAEKYGLPMPKEAAERPKKKKARRQARQGTQGRGRFRRILLILALLVVVLLAAYFLLMKDDEEAALEDITTPTATAETASEAATVEATLEATEIPALEATEEPTESPTPEPEATEAAEIATETPAIDATEDAAASALEVAAAEPLAAFRGLHIMSGRGETVGDLSEDTSFPADSELNVVVDVAEHDTPITLEVELEPRETTSSDPVQVAEVIEPGAEESIIIPIEPEGDNQWGPGEWILRLVFNGQPIEGIEFVVERTARATQARAAATAVETEEAPPPTPAVPPTLRFVYDARSIYLINISDADIDVSTLRFTQSPEPDLEVVFEATEWASDSYRGQGSIYALQPQSCLRTGVDAGAASTQVRECLRLSQWQVADPEQQFWVLNNGNVRQFRVLQGDTEIVLCEIDAGSCEFALPAAQ